MPCPYGVDIPNNFAIWNQFGIYDNKEILKIELYKILKMKNLLINVLSVANAKTYAHNIC